MQIRDLCGRIFKRWNTSEILNKQGNMIRTPIKIQNIARLSPDLYTKIRDEIRADRDAMNVRESKAVDIEKESADAQKRMEELLGRETEAHADMNDEINRLTHEVMNAKKGSSITRSAISQALVLERHKALALAASDGEEAGINYLKRLRVRRGDEGAMMKSITDIRSETNSTPDIYHQERLQKSGIPASEISEYEETFGNVLNADNAKLLFKEEGYNPADVKSVVEFHPRAGKLVGEIFTKWLQTKKNTGDGTVTFTGGGNGSGKSSASPYYQSSDFVMDSTMLSLDAARKSIQAVLDNGQTPRLIFVYRDPVEAWTQGVLKRVREGGHIVPEKTFANTHIKARENFRLLCEEFGDKVKVNVYETITGKPIHKISIEELDSKTLYTKEKLLEEIRNADYKQRTATKELGRGQQTDGSRDERNRGEVETGNADRGTGSPEEMDSGGTRQTGAVQSEPEASGVGSGARFEAVAPGGKDNDIQQDEAKLGDGVEPVSAPVSKEMKLENLDEAYRKAVTAEIVEDVETYTNPETLRTEERAVKKMAGDPTLEAVDENGVSFASKDKYWKDYNQSYRRNAIAAHFDDARSAIEGIRLLDDNDGFIKGKIHYSRKGEASDLTLKSESESSLEKYRDTDRKLFAPNGKASNLSESQWHQVRTAEFKEWFGDWENDPANASKVVDKNGEPLVVYHGTGHDFTVFNTEKTGNSETENTGAFFTDHPDIADGYQKIASNFKNDGQLFNVYLRFKNPYIINFEGRTWEKAEPESYFIVDKDGSELEWFSSREDAIFALTTHPDAKEIIPDPDGFKDGNTLVREVRESMEYDGIIFKNVKDGAIASVNHTANDYIAFKPNQIKSATDNTGAFDGKNPDIRYSRKTVDGGERVTPEGVENLKGESARRSFEQHARNVVQECKAFAGQLDAEGHQSAQLTVCQTPAVIQRVGAKAYPINISRGVVNKVTDGKHHLTLEQLKLLPAALNQPIMIFDSRTDPDSLVILTELKEGDHNAVVALKLNQKNNDFYDVNVITSLYGKENPGKIISGWITQNLLRYVHKKRASYWIRQARLQLPGVFHFRNSTFTIADQSPFVKLESWENLIKGAELSFEGDKTAQFSRKRVQKNPVMDDPVKSEYDKGLQTYQAERISNEETCKAAERYIADHGGTAKVYDAFMEGDWGFTNEKMGIVGTILANSEHVKHLPEGGRESFFVRIREQRSGVGRALQALKVLFKTGDFSYLQGIIDEELYNVPEKKRQEVIRKVKKETGVDPLNLSDEFTKKHDDPKEQSKQKKAISDLLVSVKTNSATWWDKISEYWYNAILSGLATHGANIIGNTVNLTYEMGISRFVESSLNLVMNNHDAATFKEFKKMWAAMDLKSAWQAAVESYRYEGFNVTANKWDEHSNIAIHGTKGKFIRTPGRFLRAADEFAKALVIPMESAAFATREGHSKGLRGKALAEYVKKECSNSESKARQYGYGRAQKGTFQEDLDNAGGAVVQKLIELQGTPLGKAMTFFIPFKKTPYNILKQGVMKSPVGSVKLALDTMQVMRGKRKIDDAYIKETAQQILAWGTLMAIASTNDPDDPWLTGASESYGSGKKLFTDARYPPYSIKIGGTWYSYRRIEPVSTGLQLIADFTKEWNTGESGFESVQKSVLGLSKFISDKSFLSGIGDMVKLVQDPEYSVSASAQRFVTSWVPNVVQGTLKALDNNVRDSKTRAKGDAWLGEFMRNTVGRTGLAALQPKLDYFGREIKKEDEPLSPFLWRLIIPVTTQPAQQLTATEKAIWTYNKKNPDTPYYPPLCSYTATRDKKRYYLPGANYTLVAKAIGQRFKQECESAIQTGNLNSRNPTLKDMEKIEKIRSKIRTEAWDKAIKKGMAPAYRFFTLRTFLKSSFTSL